MLQERELIERDIETYLDRHHDKELLRFVAVGSVDDGKSTLIGRLLHDTKGIYEDQLSAVKRATKAGNVEIDFSLFTDGLKAEREQGITIDVAYRYFSTEKRKFIIADTPGHVQYTRNMATGASTANVAIILIDARLGVLQQSRRHAYIASLLGIPHLAVCINKMDLVGHDRAVFERLQREFAGFASRLGFKDVAFFPISALEGDNVVHRSKNTGWYDGPTLLEHLETVPIAADRNQSDFRYPVQYVLRPDLGYRGFAGAIASGVVRRGDPVMVLPSGKTSRITHIDTFDGELEQAQAPMSVALRLEDEIDISRGDMLVHPDNRARAVQRFQAMLVWMSERPLDPDKSYYVKHTTQVARARVTEVAYHTDLETLDQLPAERLELNDIGQVTIECQRPLFVDAYRANRTTGAFILIDSLTNDTVAAGMIVGEAETTNAQVAKGGTEVSAAERRERLGQKGAVVWLTGCPGAGKSRIAYALERRLFDLGKVAMVVDPGDGLSPESDGSTPNHAADLARRCADAGLITIFAFASPTRQERAKVRSRAGAARFIEVEVQGGSSSELPSGYEPADHPNVRLAEGSDAERAAAAVITALERRGLLPSSYSI